MKKVIVMNGREKQMDDLISRQAAINLAKDICVTTKDGSIYRHRCIDPDEIRELPSAHQEPIRINLNEPIKVKLTDLGKEIYYHQYDRINQIAGRKVCEPRFPKVDGIGYTKFQLWCFIELYGEHMGLTMPNVIESLEIVYER